MEEPEFCLSLSHHVFSNQPVFHPGPRVPPNNRETTITIIPNVEWVPPVRQALVSALMFLTRHLSPGR